MRYRTSIPLILLTLLAGVALGWLLSDLRRTRPLAQIAAQTSAPASATPVPRPAAPTPSAPPATADAASPAPSPSSPASPTPRTGAATLTPRQPTPTLRTSPSPPTSAPSPSANASTQPPTPAPSASATGFIGHIVAPGETIASIAEAAGSAPDAIASYNRLTGEPEPGRALLIPLATDGQSTLDDQLILVQRGAARKRIAITLDAGAGAEPVPAMLDALRARGIHLTFFLTGKWVRDNPDLARQIVADGHELANHTFNHPDLTKAGDAALRGELGDTEAIIQETTGASSKPFFRPPYGAYNERVLRLVQQEGYLSIYWTLDSLDSVGKPKSADFLFERVTGALPPEKLGGAIILMHCGNASSAEALPRILDRFAELGYEVVPVSAVL